MIFFSCFILMDTNNLDLMDFEKLQRATSFLSETLKNYKLFKDNEHLFSSTYSCCDCCYQIRPLWNEKRIDHFNKIHEVLLCSDCFSEMPEEDKEFFVDVKYVRKAKGGLYIPSFQDYQSPSLVSPSQD